MPVAIGSFSQPGNDVIGISAATQQLSLVSIDEHKMHGVRGSVRESLSKPGRVPAWPADVMTEALSVWRRAVPTDASVTVVLCPVPREKGSVAKSGIGTARSRLPGAGSALDHGPADGVQVSHLNRAIKVDHPYGDLAGTHLDIIVLRERLEGFGIAWSVEGARAAPLAAADHGCPDLDAESVISALSCGDHILGLEHGIGK